MRKALLVALLLLPLGTAQLTQLNAQDIPIAGPVVADVIEAVHDPMIRTTLCEALGEGPCKIDGDDDGRYDALDNCPAAANADQADMDKDGVGDACDSDRDGDGVPNEEDAFPDDPAHWSDRDGDGTADGVDAFPDDPTEWADSDGDGVGDNSDVCRHYDDHSDLDGDGLADACDPDTLVAASTTEGTWDVTRLEGPSGIHDVQVASHDGLVMTFRDATGHLWFAWQDQGWHITALDYGGTFAGDAAMVSGDALHVAYYRWDDDTHDGDLLLATLGPDGWTRTALDGGPEDRGERLDAILFDGVPLVVYAAYDDGFLRAVTPGTQPVLVADDMDTVTGDVDLALIDGTPTVAYMDLWGDGLGLATFDGTWHTATVHHETSIGGSLALLAAEPAWLAWDCFDCDTLYLQSLTDGNTSAVPSGGPVQSMRGAVVGEVPILAVVTDGLHVATDDDGFLLHQVAAAGPGVGLSIHATDVVVGLGSESPSYASRDVLDWLGSRGCSTSDQDGDGLGDSCDHEPEDGPLGDLDGDGVANQDEQCTGFDDGADLDQDGVPDGCDLDRDGDGVANDEDPFPDDATETRDRDEDGVGDNGDNCKRFNPDQNDADGDGLGDACDGNDTDGDGASDRAEHRAGTDPQDARSFPAKFDRDEDGVANKLDNCRRHPNPDQADRDGDGRGDACDGERDGDGYSNGREGRAGSDPDDPTSRPDKDGDGVHDKADNCRSHANPDQEDLDGDGQGDACDKDTDGDGYKDKKERKAGTDPRDPASAPQ